jgi:hypothetical protein
MVLSNEKMDFDSFAWLGDLPDSAMCDFEAAAAGYLQAIESGEDGKLRQAHPDLTPAWWNHLRLLGEGEITKEEFLKWLLGVQPPKGDN